MEALCIVAQHVQAEGRVQASKFVSKLKSQDHLHSRVLLPAPFDLDLSSTCLSVLSGLLLLLPAIFPALLRISLRPLISMQSGIVRPSPLLRFLELSL